MSMQNPFRGPRPSAAATATAANSNFPGATTIRGGSPREAYDSFIDFDGFPATGGAASYASSPSHSTATTSINIDGSSNVQYLTMGIVGGRSPNNISNERLLPLKPAAAPLVDWPSEEDPKLVDWPVAESPPMLFDMKQQSRQQQQQQSHRDQQIFRRKGAANNSGSSSTQPSYSSSRGSSAGAHGGEEKRSNVGGRGSIIFESYEATAFADNTNNSNALHNNSSASRDFGSVIGSGQRGASILDNIVEAARAEPAAVKNAPQSHNNLTNRRDAANDSNISQGSVPSSVSKSFGNQSSTSRSFQNSSPVPSASTISRNQSTMSKSFGNNSSSPAPNTMSKKQLPSPLPEQTTTTTSSSISPQSVIRKTGVVNKLVSLFSNNKQQQQQNQSQAGSSQTSRQGSSTTNSKLEAITTKNGLQHLKQSITTSVQFHVPTKQIIQTRAQAQTIPTKAAAASQQEQQSPQKTNNHDNTSSNIPAISPARSNAQSSVTGYSGDSSSYNPTGWPGTVDKRGRTYMMEQSYSESEGESSSPQRRIRAGVGNGQHSVQPMEQQVSSQMRVLDWPVEEDPKGLRRPAEPSQIMMQDQYPVQNYRQNDDPQLNQFPEQRGFGFDESGSAMAAGQAELDDWLNGSNVGSFSVYDGESQFSQHRNNNEKSTGPIDLDDAYSYNNSTERKGGPIDLDEAYERRFDDDNDMNNGWREGREESLTNILETKTAADIQLEAALGMANNHSLLRQTTPNKSMCSNAGTTMSRSMLDDEAEAQLQGIDLSGSEMRIRASRREVSSTSSSGPKMYNEEVDFDYSLPDDACNNNNSYSSQNIIQQQQQQSQLNGRPPHPPIPQTLSEEALRWKDSQSAPPRAGGNLMLKGYRGFLEKTKDVPNLMDDSESDVSLGTGIYSVRQSGNMGLALPANARNSGGGRASSIVSSRHSSNVDSGSDVFDGLQEEPFGSMQNDILNVNSEFTQQQRRWKKHGATQPTQATQPILQQQRQHFATNDGEHFSTQFNPFTASRSGGGAWQSNTNTRPASQSQLQYLSQSSGREDVAFMEPSLDISAITRGSDANDFSHHLGDMDEAEEDFESLPDLSIYYIEPEMVRKMVRAFRKICTSQMEISSSEETMLYDFENLVDTKKAFALFEMRSRIMETDIDRGLERRGGTNVVDDIVLTPHFQAASRVRDAVIVSKAWRDGATPRDVVTAHLLTRRSARAYHVRRPIQRIRRPGVPFYNYGPQYWLEEVKWLDDTDFMLMRCQSLGAGTMKGFEMFTIGDCQSILLKMTSDNCTRLRRELRSAMVRQIEAEELMQEVIDLDTDENIVAEAEQLYMDATVEVKTLSIKLVFADKAFALVRSRMEKLVETIESLLVSIENGDESVTDEGTTSSMCSADDEETDDDSYVSQDSEDRLKLVDRAKRAELSAEVAVREAILAKQEAEKIKSDKQKEIDELKEALYDMETKSQLLASEHHRSLEAKSSCFYLDDAKSFLESTFDKHSAEDSARKNRLKQKFRDRRSMPADEEDLSSRNQNRLKDEEIYQHLDFYSRSLSRNK